jgi:hypothetical protein
VGGREGRREGWVGRTVHALGGLLEGGDDAAVLAMGHLEHQGSCCNKINTIKNNIKKDRGKCEKDDEQGGKRLLPSFLPSLPFLFLTIAVVVHNLVQQRQSQHHQNQVGTASRGSEGGKDGNGSSQQDDGHLEEREGGREEGRSVDGPSIAVG